MCSCVPVNLQMCVFSLCSSEYARSLSACVCLVLIYLVYCTGFDSFVCTDVWCSSQTRLDCVVIFSFI